VKRYLDWERRLHLWLGDAMQREFRYGDFDCVILCGDCVQAITGTDPIAYWRGKYDSPLSAYRLLYRDAVSLQDAVTQRLGDPINPRKAQRGDVLCVTMPDKPDRQYVGIDLGESVVLPQRRGIRLHDKRDVRILDAWRIG